MYATRRPCASEAVFELGVPVLGICYGMQTMAAQLGGEVAASTHREYGYAQVRARGHSRLLRDIEDHASPEGYGLLDVWMSHGDQVDALPAGFHVICETANAPGGGAWPMSERGYLRSAVPPGGDAHPQGRRILKRFVHDVCGCGGRLEAGHHSSRTA